MIVRRLNPSSSANQRVLRSLFPRPDVATGSHFAVFVDVDVQLQDGQGAARGERRKAVIRDISGVDHRGVTNLSAPIWLTGQRHCIVFRHVMQLSLLVLCWKSTLTVILPQIKKRDHFQTLATGVPKLKTWLGTQRVKTSHHKPPPPPPPPKKKREKMKDQVHFQNLILQTFRQFFVRLNHENSRSHSNRHTVIPTAEHHQQ